MFSKGRRRLAALLLAIAAAAGAMAAASATRGAGQGRDAKKELAEGLLMVKYGTPFTVTEYDGTGSIGMRYAAWAHPDGSPGMVFRAEVSRGRLDFDTYPQRYACAALEKTLMDAVSQDCPGGGIAVHAETGTGYGAEGGPGLDPVEFSRLNRGSPYRVSVYIDGGACGSEKAYGILGQAAGAVPGLSGEMEAVLTTAEGVEEAAAFYAEYGGPGPGGTGPPIPAVRASVPFSGGKLELSYRQFAGKLGTEGGVKGEAPEAQGRPGPANSQTDYGTGKRGARKAEQGTQGQTFQAAVRG